MAASSAVLIACAFLHRDQIDRVASCTRQFKNESRVYFVCKPLIRLRNASVGEGACESSRRVVRCAPARITIAMSYGASEPDFG